MVGTDQSSLLALFPTLTMASRTGCAQPGAKDRLCSCSWRRILRERNDARPHQVCGEKCQSNSVAGLQLSGSFEAVIDITQGCQPITEPMVITKAEGNLISEINDRPALEVFAKLLRPSGRRSQAGTDVHFRRAAGRPESRHIGPGQYLVRNIIGLDPAKASWGLPTRCEKDSPSFLPCATANERGRI